MMPPTPGFPGPPPPRRTNAMAIASLVSAFLFAPLGIVFGHVSLSQIKRSGEDGHGLAIAGLVIGYALTVVTILSVIVIVAFSALVVRWSQEWANRYGHNGLPNVSAGPPPGGPLPPFTPPATLGSNCQYPATIEPASKPVNPPRTGRVATTPPTVAVTVTTNRGVIGLQLDDEKAPCTVNNFTSLVQQHFYDGTTCHRLTTSSSKGLVQCGDPTGSGTGGPGYRFPNEYPTNQYRITDPALQSPVTYPRGTLAMANTGAGTNGSQFLLVYENSELPPTYTVFGSIDPAGLTVVDGVAAAGVEGGGDDGAPAQALRIDAVRLS